MMAISTSYPHLRFRLCASWLAGPIFLAPGSHAGQGTNPYAPN